MREGGAALWKGNRVWFSACDIATLNHMGG